jgi:hypothetical protein
VTTSRAFAKGPPPASACTQVPPCHHFLVLFFSRAGPGLTSRRAAAGNGKQSRQRHACAPAIHGGTEPNPHRESRPGRARDTATFYPISPRSRRGHTRGASRCGTLLLWLVLLGGGSTTMRMHHVATWCGFMPGVSEITIESAALFLASTHRPEQLAKG